MNKKASPNAHLLWAILFGSVILLGAAICLADFAAGDYPGGRSGFAVTIAGCLGMTVVLFDLAGPAQLRSWKRYDAMVRAQNTDTTTSPRAAPRSEAAEAAARHREDLDLKARAASDRLKALARACAESPSQTPSPAAAPAPARAQPRAQPRALEHNPTAAWVQPKGAVAYSVPRSIGE